MLSVQVGRDGLAEPEPEQPVGVDGVVERRVYEPDRVAEPACRKREANATGIMQCSKLEGGETGKHDGIAVPQPSFVGSNK